MTFFMDNFKMEAEALGYTVVNRREDAGYIFRYEVSPNLVLYSDGTMAMAPPDEDQYIIQITMISNADSIEMASFSFGFTNLYDMYDYTQYLAVKGVVYIPAAEESAVIVEAEPEDDSWRTQWLYIRASLDFPITFYTLGEVNTTYNPKTSPNQVHRLGNLENAFPGITVGAEVQFLDWMSAEPKIQIGWENLNDTDFFTLTAGLDIKFPLKFIRNVVLEPYISGVYPLPFTIPEVDIFAEPLSFGVGAGLQVGIKGFGTGGFFIDISYTYFFGDAVLRNEFKGKPETVAYQRSIIRIGAGYKFGLFNRN
jgi:hypothetical protein